MAELKPCPFCGGYSELYVTKHIPSGYDYTPRCLDTSCCGRLSKKYTVRETAIYAWNRRTTDKELEFTRQYIHDQGLEWDLLSKWEARKNG